MPRSAENRSTISNHAGEIVTRPASTLARSSRSSTISVSSRGRRLDELRPASPARRSAARRARSSSMPGDAADRAERRAELVAHVGQEPALQLGRLAQLVRRCRRARRRARARRGWSRRARPAAPRSAAPASSARSAAAASGSRSSAMGVASAMRQSARDDHDGRVVAAAAEVAAQHAGDDRRMPLQQARIGVERPAVADAVRVHHQQTARAATRSRTSCTLRICSADGAVLAGSRPRLRSPPTSTPDDVADAGVAHAAAGADAAPRDGRAAACRPARGARARQNCRGVGERAARRRRRRRASAASAASGPWPRPSATITAQLAVALGDRARCRRRPSSSGAGSATPRPREARAPAAGRRPAADARQDHACRCPAIGVDVEVVGQPPHRAQSVARRAGGRVAVLQAALHVGHARAARRPTASPACGRRATGRAPAAAAARRARAGRGWSPARWRRCATSPRGVLVEAAVACGQPRGGAARLADLARRPTTATATCGGDASLPARDRHARALARRPSRCRSR